MKLKLSNLLIIVGLLFVGYYYLVNSPCHKRQLPLQPLQPSQPLPLGPPGLTPLDVGPGLTPLDVTIL